MSYKEDFSRLEAIVEKLLAQVDALRRQNSELQAALQSRELELNKVQDESGSLHEERGEILSRINKLISSIEEWEEKEQAAGEETEEQAAFRMSGE